MTNDTPSRPRTNKPLYLVALALFANAAAFLYIFAPNHSPDLLLSPSAFAQTPTTGQPLGARGIYMMPAQLGPTTFGLYLMDVDAGTICVYRALPETSRFRLMASRSFRNDRFLEDYNNESPTPRDVQRLIDTQHQRQNLENKTNTPTVDQSPKPDENTPDTLPAK